MSDLLLTAALGPGTRVLTPTWVRVRPGPTWGLLRPLGPTEHTHISPQTQVQAASKLALHLADEPICRNTSPVLQTGRKLREAGPVTSLSACSFTEHQLCFQNCIRHCGCCHEMALSLQALSLGARRVVGPLPP